MSREDSCGVVVVCKSAAAPTSVSLPSNANLHAGARCESVGALRPSPSAWQMVFASIFTPTWSLGLLLFACLYLPCYEGCSDNTTIYGYQTFAGEELTSASAYWIYLRAWPFGFGLFVALGTIALAAGPSHRIRLQWSGYLVLIILYTALFVVYRFTAAPSEQLEFVGAAFLAGPALLLLALILVTSRYGRSRFRATMWIQGGLAVCAALTVSVITPVTIFAKGFLIGGILAHGSSVFLIMASLVQWLDGERALTRLRGESPLQLSLKSVLLLMLVGGITFAWAVLPCFPKDSRESDSRVSAQSAARISP